MPQPDESPFDGLDRRRVLQGIAAALAITTGTVGPAAQAQADDLTVTRQNGTPDPLPPGVTPVVAALVHPRMILQDLVGPLTELNLLRSQIHLVAATTEPVLTDLRIPVTPTDTFETCPRTVDVLFVPGGLDGTIDAMEDPATLRFLAEVGPQARWVFGICTGTLLLGAAGLLHGYRATGHWYIRDLLSLFGAQPVDQRVVRQGNRLTGAGATSGLDAGLALVALLRDQSAAERIQLVLEYAPKPPFNAGTPRTAPPALTASVLEARAASLTRAREVALRLR